MVDAAFAFAAVSRHLKQRQLDCMLKRNEGAHANWVENYPLLVGVLGFATMAGFSPEDIDRAGLVYTVARV
ncbi:hypothetical protein PG988_011541 [Apiospora saccharicola]